MLALSKKIDIVIRLREAPGLDAALQHEVTCSHEVLRSFPGHNSFSDGGSEGGEAC
jgi:hypothetical protein